MGRPALALAALVLAAILLVLQAAAAAPATAPPQRARARVLLAILAQCPGTLAPSDARAVYTAASDLGQDGIPASKLMAWAPNSLGVQLCCLDRVHVWSEDFQDWVPANGVVQFGSKAMISRAKPDTACRGCGDTACPREEDRALQPPPGGTGLAQRAAARTAQLLAPGSVAALDAPLPLQATDRRGVPGLFAAGPKGPPFPVNEDRRRLLSARGGGGQQRALAPPTANFSFGTELYNKLLDPERYNRNVLPNAASAGNSGVTAVQVEMRVALYQIVGIDLYGGSLKVSVWLQMYWDDPRLQWNPAEYNNTLFMYFGNPAQGDTEVWVPDLCLWNGAQPMVLSLGTQAIRADHTGRMFWARDGTLDIACNFQGLQSFPFGKYSCAAEFGSWNFGVNTVNLHWLGKGWILGGTETSVKEGDTSLFKEYYLTGATTRRALYPPIPGFEEEGEQPSLILGIQFSRGATIYAFKVLVPQIMLTAVSLASLWLSPECGERLGLAITVPLAVAVYDLLTFSSVPISNRITFISALGLVCFLTSILVLVESAMVIQLHHLELPRWLSGAGTVRQTFLAWREQTVWVRVLRIIMAARAAEVQKQLDAVAKSARSLKSWRSLKGLTVAAAAAAPPATASAAAAATASDVQQDDDGAEANAPLPAAQAVPPTGVRSRWVSLQSATAPAAESSESRDANEWTAQRLRFFLQSLLDDTSRSSARPRRHVRHAVAVFGLDPLVDRLRRAVGEERDRADGGAPLGTYVGAAEMRHRLAGEFRTRWRLLGELVDNVARWTIPVLYVVSLVVAAATLA